MYLSIYRYVYVCIYRERERESESESERCPAGPLRRRRSRPASREWGEWGKCCSEAKKAGERERGRATGRASALLARFATPGLRAKMERLKKFQRHLPESQGLDCLMGATFARHRSLAVCAGGSVVSHPRKALPGQSQPRSWISFLVLGAGLLIAKS